MDKKVLGRYIIVGIVTTAINIVIYWLLTNLLHIHFLAATTISWVVSVLFSFTTSKSYVFNSGEKGIGSTMKQLSLFILLRASSYLLDTSSMILLVGMLHFSDTLSKIAVNILVVIFNYVLSKNIVFKSNAA